MKPSHSIAASPDPDLERPLFRKPSSTPERSAETDRSSNLVTPLCIPEVKLRRPFALFNQ